MPEVELLPGKKALCPERNGAMNSHHAKMINSPPGNQNLNTFSGRIYGKEKQNQKQQTSKVLNPAKKFGLQIKPGKNL